MKKLYIHFKSNVLFELEINGEYISSTQNTNQTIDIQVNQNKKIFFRFNPISNTNAFIPYTQCIEVKDGKLEYLNTNLDIIEFSNNHYLINLNAIPINLTNNQLITKSLDKTYICVNQTFPTTINVYNNNVLKNTITLTNQSSNSIINQIQNCIVIKNCLINGIFEICILDRNSLALLNQTCCETIEDCGNTIKFLIRPNNNSNYANIINYDLINQKSEKETILLSKSNKNKTSPEIIGYNFLLAIQNKNIKAFEELCSTNISNKLTNEVIHNIFGNINKIYYNPFTIEQPSYIISNNNKNKKIYIKIDNNEIIDFNIED